MIKVSIPNKNTILNSKLVEDYIKQEEEKEKASRRASYTYAPSNYPTAYQKYCSLYAFASKSYNRFEIKDGFKVFFYEWSDLSREPLTFSTKTAFLRFIEKSNIFIDAQSKDRLSMGTYGLYASCVKGTNKLVVQYTFCALVSAWGNASFAQTNSTNTVTTKERIMAQDNINFYFYEMSDLHRKPIKFTSWKTWMGFMEKYKLRMSEHNEKRLKALSDKEHYGICIPGYPVVAARNGIEKLQDIIDNATIPSYDRP